MSPYLGKSINYLQELLVGIMSSFSLLINVKIEVNIMINTIIMMCLAAGTALVGRSGDMFPKPRRIEYLDNYFTDIIWDVRRRGSIPLPSRHFIHNI